MKVAQFTLRGTMAQSIRWKRGSEQEGFSSVGSWAASALDAYLEGRRRAGWPIQLAWHRGAVPVVLEGHEVRLPGMVSYPFGVFRGRADGPGTRACQRFTLVHTPARRIIATLRTLRQCQALASELAPILARDEHGGAPIVARHVSEQA